MTQFERTFNLMKKPWFIVAYIVLVILVYYFVDSHIAIYFKQLNLRTDFHLLNILTAFGQWKVYLVLFFLLALYFRYIQKNAVYETRSWYLLGCVFIPNLIGFVLKIALSRARPDLLFESNFFGFYWFQFKDAYWSFPSGHTVTVVGLAAGLGVLFPRYFYALLCLALLVVLTRVLLYRHYLSDVMAGFYISIIAIGLFTEYLRRNHYLK